MRLFDEKIIEKSNEGAFFKYRNKATPFLNEPKELVLVI